MATVMTQNEILIKVANGEIPVDEATKLLEAQSPAKGSIFFKVSAKGALSVYGLQRMPVTLYVQQWERLWDVIPAMQSFAKENAGKLDRKPPRDTKPS